MNIVTVFHPTQSSVAVADLEPGDILACWGTDWGARFVSLMTSNPFAPRNLRWAPSHVAIICDVPDRGRLWVESTTLCQTPCVMTGQPTHGLQTHHPQDRLGEYVESGGEVHVYRLSPIDRLSDSESAQLTSILIDGFVKRGLGYDYGGALISGTRFVRLLDGVLLRRYRNLHEVFCSELIAATLQRLCRLNREDPTRFNPGRLVRRLIHEGTYYHAGRLIE
ncbi:hypothetical protein [Thalassoroseus pseudoceratinae]|uniref:hypothetical protein n=1 Tax=Thalassoroseus pseudoceratinae TaxID=2713176 RepID=UPI00142177C9|nr:hypothetical protein [Thalassoroseus pseudoceratinae]